MRILFVISGLIYGGAETQVIRLAHGLAKKGHSVGLHVLSTSIPRLNEIDSRLVTCVVDPRKSSFDFSLIARLRNRLLTENFDVVIGFLYDANLYVRLASFGLRVTVVNTERSSGYKLSWKNRLAHSVTRFRVDRLIANSNTGQLHATEYLGYSPLICSTIWNGIDETPVDQSVYAAEISSGGELLVIGRIDPAKDHGLAIRTLVELRKREPHWRLTIVGGENERDHAYANSLRKLVEQLNVADVVRFVGAQPNVKSYLKHATVLLSASLREGFPNVVLEAMVCGVPVVSTECSDIRQILPLEWQVSSARSEVQLASMVIKARDQRPSIVIAQSEVLSAHFSTDRMVDQYEKTLLLTIRSGSAPVLETENR